MSSTQIGRLYGVTHGTVLRWLKQYGIKRRSLREAHFAFHGKDVPKEFNDRNVMYRLYVEEHRTKEQLGEYFGCAPHVIDRVLREMNIAIRGASEAKIGVQRGEKHHNWKGGVTDLYSRCREYVYRNQAPIVKKRDGHRCVICGTSNNLHVHHQKPFIDIIREICNEHPDLNEHDNINQLYEIIVNDSRFNDLNNMVTCCSDCHMYIMHGYNKTIRNEAPYRGTLNDYPVMEYTQARGNGGAPT